MTKETIVIVGFGWVGQANAITLNLMGYDVYYYDIAPPAFHYQKKYEHIYKNIKPLNNLLEKDAPSTWYFICVGDKVGENGIQDTSLIKKACENLENTKGGI